MSANTFSDESEVASESAEAQARDHHSTTRVWIAKPLYEFLPTFYILSGLLALVSAIYVTHWYWAMPLWFVFGCLCLQAGVFVWKKRRDYRSRIRE